MTNYHDAIALLRMSDMWSWFRDSQTLSIYRDSYAADRRTVWNLELKLARAELKTLNGWNPKDRTWKDYCSPCGSVELSGKGKKALLEFISEFAMKESGYLNPPAVHFYKLA